MNETSGELSNSRFLAFVVLAATGFLGEVQLAGYDHSAPDLLGRVVLTMSTALAAVLAIWGAFAAAAAFTEETIEIGKGRFSGDPTREYPWAAKLGARVQRWMEGQIRSSVRHGGHLTPIDGIVGLFLALLGAILIWAAL